MIEKHAAKILLKRHSKSFFNILMDLAAVLMHGFFLCITE